MEHKTTVVLQVVVSVEGGRRGRAIYRHNTLFDGFNSVVIDEDDNIGSTNRTVVVVVVVVVVAVVAGVVVVVVVLFVVVVDTAVVAVAVDDYVEGVIEIRVKEGRC